MNNQIKEFDIDTWSDEMMQIFERTNKATYTLVGTPRQEGKSLFQERYQEAFKESQGSIEVVEFDTQPMLTEAQFKNKVMVMSNAGKYQPIYDEFILKTKEVLPKIKAKDWYREFEKKNKKGLK
jgi:hypothetical protein